MTLNYLEHIIFNLVSYTIFYDKTFNELQVNEMWITKYLFLEYLNNSEIVFNNSPFSDKNLSLALQRRNAETQILPKRNIFQEYQFQ